MILFVHVLSFCLKHQDEDCSKNGFEACTVENSHRFAGKRWYSGIGKRTGERYVSVFAERGTEKS